jgi:hypothetical protein
MAQQVHLPDRFECYVVEVAIRTCHDGMSASKLDTQQFLEPTDTWGFPKHPGRTAILPPETDLASAIKAFIAANASLLAAADAWLGTWVHPQTGYFYLDITTSRDQLDDARRMALENSVREGRQIVALYNSYRRETIFLEPVDM